MTWWDLRRILRDLERAADRWRLVEATRGPGADRWRVIVDDGDTGLWHTLDAYTDLTAARPILPRGLVPPAPCAVTPTGQTPARRGPPRLGGAAGAHPARPRALPGLRPRPARGGGAPDALDRHLG